MLSNAFNKIKIVGAVFFIIAAIIIMYSIVFTKKYPTPRSVQGCYLYNDQPLIIVYTQSLKFVGMDAVDISTKFMKTNVWDQIMTNPGFVAKKVDGNKIVFERSEPGTVIKVEPNSIIAISAEGEKFSLKKGGC